jgi:hypothetical protein
MYPEPPSFLLGRAIRARSYIRASRHQRLERFGVIEKQTVLDHAGIDDKRITEVKYGFLDKTKLADRSIVRGFAALVKRRDTTLVLIAEEAIIRDQKTRPCSSGFAAFGQPGSTSSLN